MKWHPSMISGQQVLDLGLVTPILVPMEKETEIK